MGAYMSVRTSTARVTGALLVVASTIVLVTGATVMSLLAISNRLRPSRGAGVIAVLIGAGALTAIGLRIWGLERWRGRLGVALTAAGFGSLSMGAAFLLAISAPELAVTIDPRVSRAVAITPLAVLAVAGLAVGRLLIASQRHRGSYLERRFLEDPARIQPRRDAKEQFYRPE